MAFARNLLPVVWKELNAATPETTLERVGNTETLEVASGPNMCLEVIPFGILAEELSNTLL